MVVKFLEQLLYRLRESQKVYEQRILCGSFADLSEYKLIAGKYQGLVEAERETKILYKEMFETRRLSEGVHHDIEDIEFD